jgi:hypothetical protein
MQITLRFKPVRLRVLGIDDWWRMTGSNRRPPACKAGALPAELIPQYLDAEGSVIPLL